MSSLVVFVSDGHFQPPNLTQKLVPWKQKVVAQTEGSCLVQEHYYQRSATVLLHYGAVPSCSWRESSASQHTSVFTYV